ncbi:hypothetical protein V6Z12_A10G089200 [Gossypium hirsutum]
MPHGWLSVSICCRSRATLLFFISLPHASRSKTTLLSTVCIPHASGSKTFESLHEPLDFQQK